jgi:hypothetical protein
MTATARRDTCLHTVTLRVLLVLVVTATPAAAEPGFAWQAPSSCPDAGDVRARIERRLGRALDDVAVGISVDIAAQPTGYVARVDARAVTVSGGEAPPEPGSMTRGSNASRTLTSTRCDELADAVAVIVARLATEARSGAGEVHLRFQRTTIPAAPREMRVWGGGVRLLALSGIGGVPSVGVGGELAGFVRRRDMFAEVGIAGWGRGSVDLAQGAPGRVDIRHEYVVARVGWSPERMPLRAWLAGELGSMHGLGVDLNVNGAGAGRWEAIGSGFGVGWPISPWIRLVGTFEVAVPFARPRFQLADGEDIYEPAPLTARACLGFEAGWR